MGKGLERRLWKGKSYKKGAIRVATLRDKAYSYRSRRKVASTADWEVLEASVSRDGQWLIIEGVNHCVEPQERFHWWIDRYSDVDSYRYDWSHCNLGPGAEDKLNQIREARRVS